ncbi:MAG: hypothetical protein KGO81_08480 [Bacteroidota bacterium]|nr:hypothetical protein [Bacteroidota bacterium]
MRILYLLTVLFVITIFGSCNRKPEKGWKRITAFNYQIDYPENWKIKNDKSGYYEALSITPTDSLPDTLRSDFVQVIEFDSLGISFDEFKQWGLTHFSDVFHQNIRVFNNVPVTNFGDAEAWVFQFYALAENFSENNKTEEDVTNPFQLYLVSGNGKFYGIITTAAFSGEPTKRSATLSRIVGSFKLIKHTKKEQQQQPKKISPSSLLES